MEVSQLGTYQVYSLANQFNQDNPIMLTQEGREGAIYEMDNKAEIEQQREEEAKEQFALAKQEVVANDDYDEETKEQRLIEMNDSMSVIGYKRQKYSGSCWKKALPDRRWLLVDTT